MPIDNVVWMIPLLSIVLGIGTILTLIITLHRAKIRELDQRHAERMAAIDKGLDPFGAAADPRIPGPETAAPAADRPPPRHLLRGLIWLGVGLAVVLGGGEMSRNGFWGLLGWIAAAVGGAQVVYYVMEGRRAPPPAPPPERPPGADRGV